MRYKGDKGKLWKIVSEYVRKRDGNKCVTCNRDKADGWVMNAGHYQPMGYVGSNNTLSWDEFNIHCQCARCNGPGLGEQELMANYIERKYGKKKLEELKSRRYKVDPVKDWKALIEYYKEKLKSL